MSLYQVPVLQAGAFRERIMTLPWAPVLPCHLSVIPALPTHHTAGGQSLPTCGPILSTLLYALPAWFLVSLHADPTYPLNPVPPAVGMGRWAGVGCLGSSSCSCRDFQWGAVAGLAMVAETGSSSQKELLPVGLPGSKSSF